MMRIRLVFGWTVAVACIFSVAASAQSSDDAASQLAAEGRQALAAGDYAEAQSKFEKLAKLEPSIAEVHAALAAICYKQRDYEEAIREIRTAQKLKPGLPRLDSLLGLSLSELGRYSEGIPSLEKGFKQSTDPATRRLCGLQLLRAYTGLSRDADAVETALALNRLYPDDPEVLYHTGRVYGNFAYITMEKLHDSAPNSIWMLQAQGEANESQRNYDAAIIAFNHVLEIDPRRPGIHYRLGRIYLARLRDAQKPEDREEAIRQFEAELSVDPENGNAAYEIANFHAQSGHVDEARKEFERVIDRYPDFEEALVGLASIDLESQRPADAISRLNRATKLRPDDEVAWYRLAQAQRATGNKEGQQEAIAVFKKLHSGTPAGLRKPNAEDEITPQELGTVAEP